MMTPGICIPAALLSAARSDATFLELQAREIIAMDKDSRSRVFQFGHAIKAFNSILPSGLSVVGPRVDREYLGEWARQLAQIATQLDVKVVTVGSGTARSIPPGFPLEQAERQFRLFLEQLLHSFAATDVHLCLEPLRRRETNFINTIAEALAFLESAHLLGSVALTLDPMHVFFPSTDESDIRNMDLASIGHVHISDMERKPINSTSGLAREFFELLVAQGYSGMISLECAWSDFAVESEQSLETLLKWARENSDVLN